MRTRLPSTCSRGGGWGGARGAWAQKRPARRGQQPLGYQRRRLLGDSGGGAALGAEPRTAARWASALPLSAAAPPPRRVTSARIRGPCWGPVCQGRPVVCRGRARPLPSPGKARRPGPRPERADVVGARAGSLGPVGGGRGSVQSVPGLTPSPLPLPWKGRICVAPRAAQTSRAQSSGPAPQSRSESSHCQGSDPE